jgi:2-C-methyl-D-erythritol 4-phosphate cytidylyltransferase
MKKLGSVLLAALLATSVGASVAGAVEFSVLSLAKAVADPIATLVSSVVTPVASTAKVVVRPVTSVVNVVAAPMASAAKVVTNPVASAARTMTDPVVSAARVVTDPVMSAAKTMTDPVVSIARAATDPILSVTRDLLQDTLYKTVKIHFTDSNGEHIKHTFAAPWDDGLFARPATEFSQNLAATAMALSAAVYSADYIQEAYANMGLTDSKQWNYSENFDAYSIARKTITVNGRRCNLIVAALRGTGGVREWGSNLTQNIGGFETFATEVMESMRAYAKNPATDKVLVTGHSRGAAAANILGKLLVEAGIAQKKNVYAYTFATPNTTTSADAANYNNVYNIVNAEDVVVTVPPQGVKYGTTLVFNRNQFPMMKQFFAEITGKELDETMNSKALINGKMPTLLEKALYAHATETYLSFISSSMIQF